MTDEMKYGKPYEYFCNGCGQIRLSYRPNTHDCANCNSSNIVRGRVGKLDKDKLKAEFVRNNENKG